MSNGSNGSNGNMFPTLQQIAGVSLLVILIFGPSWFLPIY